MSGGDQDWQVGDMALCVETSWSYNGQVMAGPTPGSIYRVTRAQFFSQLDLFRIYGFFAEAGIWLGFAEFGDSGFHASGFRKIQPHTPDAEDAETIALLNGHPVEPATPELV